MDAFTRSSGSCPPRDWQAGFSIVWFAAAIVVLVMGCQGQERAVDKATQDALDRHEQLMDRRDREMDREQRERRAQLQNPETLAVLPTGDGSLAPAPTDFSQFGTPTKNGLSQVASDSNSSVLPPGNAASSEADTLSVESLPGEVVAEFLSLLQQNQALAAKRLLTDVAQVETSRAQLELEAPGDIDSRVSVSETRYATSQREIAEVDTVFSSVDSSMPVARLSWMLRKQRNGWKIYGMIVFDEDDKLDLLSFENPVDLARIVDSVETEVSPPVRSANQVNGLPPASLR